MILTVLELRCFNIKVWSYALFMIGICLTSSQRSHVVILLSWRWCFKIWILAGTFRSVPLTTTSSLLLSTWFLGLVRCVMRCFVKKTSCHWHYDLSIIKHLIDLQANLWILIYVFPLFSSGQSSFHKVNDKKYYIKAMAVCYHCI